VQALLGPSMQAKFLREYEAAKLDIEYNSAEDLYIDKLNRLEMKFLFDNIR